MFLLYCERDKASKTSFMIFDFYYRPQDIKAACAMVQQEVFSLYPFKFLE